MALTREQKEKIVKNLTDKINRQKVMVFVNFKGLKVKDVFELKVRLKECDSELMVAKKTLMQVAFNSEKVKVEQEKLESQAAIIFGFGDEILPAKTAYKFSKENKNLKILGGYFENEFRESEEIISLAQTPGREELLARLLSSLNAPVSNLVRVLQGNLKGLVYVLSQIKVNQK